MKHHVTRIALALCSVLSLLAIPPSASAISITGFNSSDQNALDAFVNTIIDPTNVTLVAGSTRFIGSANASLQNGYQSGTFSGGGADIGFDTGLILSNGNALNIPGNTLNDQNYSNPIWADGPPGSGVFQNMKDPEALAVAPPGWDLWSKSWGGPSTGVADLSGLVNGADIYDANAIEFKFTLPKGTWDIRFEYVFASEEYINNVNSPFNDAFGFFLQGHNVAVLSDGTTIVSVNSINPSVNNDLYRNNVEGYFTYNPGVDYGIFDTTNPNYIPSLNLGIEPDGLTKVLQTQSLVLSEGEYTARLIIGDLGDNALDSAVFIKGNSFSASAVPAVPEPGTLILIGTGLVGVCLLRRRNQA